MLMKTLFRRPVIALAALVGAGAFSASTMADFHRDYITIVGSSAVVPFAKAVGERFSKARNFQAPLLQSTGTGGGIKLFCEGLGAESPDIVITSRAIKPKEREECRTNGVSDLLELKIGYGGIVLAQSRKAPPLSLTRKEARLALAKWIADADGKLVPNPHRTWKDINPALPDGRIEVYGPPVASGGYDAFVDLISDLECKGRPWIADGKREPTPDQLKKCRSLREDGVYIEGRENDEDHLAHLAASPSKLAIFDYKLVEANRSQIRAVPIDGVEPAYETIATKAYAGTRPLFLYVKKSSLAGTPGLREFLAEFTSENAWGDKGYLRTLGLVAMPSDERATYTAEVRSLGISPSLATSRGASPAKGTKPAAKKKKK